MGITSGSEKWANTLDLLSFSWPAATSPVVKGVRLDWGMSQDQPHDSWSLKTSLTAQWLLLGLYHHSMMFTVLLQPMSLKHANTFCFNQPDELASFKHWVKTYHACSFNITSVWLLTICSLVEVYSQLADTTLIRKLFTACQGLFWWQLRSLVVNPL